MHCGTDIRCFRRESLGDERKSSSLPHSASSWYLAEKDDVIDPSVLSDTASCHASPRLSLIDTLADQPLRGRPDGVLPSHRGIDHDDDDRGCHRDPGFEENQPGWVG